MHNVNHPDYPRSVEEYRTFDETLDRSKYYRQRYAFLENKAIVGFGYVTHVTDMFHPKKFWIEVLVDPRLQGRGIGNAIYEYLMKELRRLEAITAWAGSRQNLPVLIGFYEKRGFVEKQIVWESRLDPRTTDPERFREYPEKVRKQGITITNLAEERKNPDSLRKLHGLVQLISSDMPQPKPYTPISYEQWEAFEMKSPDLLPEAYVIAKDGSKYVGLSVVWRIEQEPRGLFQGNTGVRREYRGKGIAVAMKLRLIDYARQHGYERIKAWNDTVNMAMLAVNMKLGFKREVGWITLEKDLTR